MHHYSTFLDYPKLLPVTWQLDKARQCWQVEIEITYVTRERLITHLLHMLRLRVSKVNHPFERQGDKLIATADAIALTDSAKILLNGKALLRVRLSGGALQHTLPDYHRLTVAELRMLAQYPHPQLPYSREDAVWQGDYIALQTDLHTHLSSQISAEGLLQAAAEADACYPVELLELLPIPYQHFATEMMPSFLFTPAASDGLRCEMAGQQVEGVKVRELLKDKAVTEALQRAMVIPADEVITFDELERRVYRMRNPLAKHGGTIASSLLQVARSYAAQGIRYAELAVTAALNPDWLEVATVAIQQAEAETGVQLRLLAALPRALTPMETLRQLHLVKLVARHPCVVGIDFLGYEANKTQNFAWALNNIARWAAAQAHGKDMTGGNWCFADDFILRVHAGENGKNPDNVADVLAIAARHGVRVRVGHAAYGEVSESEGLARKLAARDKLIIEFNPDSNIAMNNIDMAEQLPIAAWARAGIPFVIASDGAGIYQTDNKQLFAAALFAGLRSEDITRLLTTESRHIVHQQQLYREKAQAFTAHYPEAAAFYAELRQAIRHWQTEDAMQRLAHKTPLLIAGASGRSWGRIDAVTQVEIARGIHQLVRCLNPEKVYFALGRIKHEGIGQILDDALTEYAQEYPDAAPFDVVGMLSMQQNMPTLATHLNHIVPLHGELMSVPTQMTAKLAEHQGCALYIGGAAFTRDFIKRSEELGIPFGVMAEVRGASGEKALVLDARYVFHGAEGMLAHVRQMLGESMFLS